jgi:hypothetical protein
MLSGELIKGGRGFMKTLIGGAVVVALGIIGMSVWWKYFLQFFVGAIPVTLLLGGGLALYLGFDELKDTRKKEEPSFDTSTASDETENTNMKSETETLNAEKSE